jgi:hypothetical protein
MMAVKRILLLDSEADPGPPDVETGGMYLTADPGGEGIMTEDGENIIAD